MARKNKYTEEKLLESVIFYSEAFPNTKITASALAKWASDNVMGLEGVKGYHYTRPAQIKDPKTGRIVSCAKECLIKINEINTLCDRDSRMVKNPVLSNDAIDKFFSLTILEQRKYLQEAREEVNGLRREMSGETRRNTFLKAENEELKEKCTRACELKANIRKDTEKLNRLVCYLKKKIDDETAKKALAEIGVTDGMLKLTVYMKKIKDETKELFDVRDSIRAYLALEQEEEAEELCEDRDDEGTDDESANSGISDLINSLYGSGK